MNANENTPRTEGEAQCIAQGINVALLRQVAEQIVQHPKAFNMAYYFSSAAYYIEGFQKESALVSECGATACIAGWAIALRNADVEETAQEKACGLLGITDDQGDLLFHDSNWPSDLSREYSAREWESDDIGMANVAARRIEHFIQSGGAE